MTNQPAYLNLEFEPIADPAAVVVAGAVRFTVLTPRVIRLEYAPDGRFEDRPSQVFWYRRQPVPSYEVAHTAEGLKLRTEHLELTFQDRGDGFTPETLTVTLLENGATWRYGDEDTDNLLGTTRTLDEVSGSTVLEAGLLSRSGWTVVDDSRTLVFDANNWLQPRQAAAGSRDLYFFGYGQAYQSCLDDYVRLAGRTPLLPRWVLGNWWSRYWAYSADELRQLMTDFRQYAVPLSVCIVDMDWHLVNIGPGINGWTGYTWNRELFPDPAEFIAWLHEQGLRTALNLHPALGIRPHEDAYPEMARRLSVDPDSRKPIPFDITDPEFTRAYFEVLHHPQEAIGVDFWWMDWQQGQQTKVAGLDPLWWLNHLHFFDLGRAGKRHFIFSRWGGLGNHRYPIGFSGDTQVTWDSLAFQPYFTATAANVGYGWWSHDIGGHMQGIEDRELYTRWVQFGVFSPIFRLHSTKNPYHERRPWGYDAEVFGITRDAMQLRHALVPYLYTLSWLNETENRSPIRPMYHVYPETDEAYACPQQYLFGGDLIVAPFTSPADPDTRLARQVVWLPPGDWYDFFSGQHLRGDAWYALHGELRDIPVFARAGALIPLAPRAGWGGTETPEVLEIHCFAGADGQFTLFEDDGQTLAYRDGTYALTEFAQTWRDGALTVTVRAPEGDPAFIPDTRRLRFHFVGVGPDANVTRAEGDQRISVPATYDAEREVLSLAELELSKRHELRIHVQPASGPLLSRRDRTQETAARMLAAFRMESLAKVAVAARLDGIAADPAVLDDLMLEMKPAHARALLEVLLQAGVHHITDTRQPHLVVVWNNRADPAVRFRYSWANRRKWHTRERFHGHSGAAPSFLALRPTTEAWRVTLDYGGLAQFDEPRTG